MLQECAGLQACELTDTQECLCCLLRSLLRDSPGIKFPWKTQYPQNDHSRGSYTGVV